MGATSSKRETNLGSSNRDRIQNHLGLIIGGVAIAGFGLGWAAFLAAQSAGGLRVITSGRLEDLEKIAAQNVSAEKSTTQSPRLSTNNLFLSGVHVGRALEASTYKDVKNIERAGKQMMDAVTHATKAEAFSEEVLAKFRYAQENPSETSIVSARDSAETYLAPR